MIMEKTLTVEEEVQEMLDNSMTTAEALAKLKTLSLPKWDEDPEFIADLAKGQITEDILAVMEEDGINKSQLAEKLGKSRQYISRVLNETANFTIDSLAEIACALNRKIEVRMIGKTQHVFITDNYRSPESEKSILATEKYNVQTKITDLFEQKYEFEAIDASKTTYSYEKSPEDTLSQVAEPQAEYKVNKEKDYEKELKFAS